MPLKRRSIVAAVLALIALATVQQVWAIHARTLVEFERRGSVAAEAAAAYVGQTIASITLAFQNLDGDLTTPSLVFTAAPSEIRQAMRRVQASSPLIQGLGLIDSDGHVVVSADQAPPQPVDLSDRPYFVFHRDNPSNELRISRPVLARPGNAVSIPLSMRAEDPDGTFRGVVAARLDPSQLAAFFARLGVDAVSLVDADGVLYARFPEVDLMAAEARPLPEFAANGPFNIKIKTGQTLLGYSIPVPRTGLFVRATSFETDVTETWLRRAASPVLIGIVASFFAMLALHLVERRARHVEALIGSTAAGARAARDEASHFRDVARSKSDFLAHMSHEIRTPLNAIIGFSEVIEHDAMKLGVPARYRDYAADIRFSAGHLLGVINRILDMSKIEAGKWQLSLGRVNAAALVANVAHLAAQRAQKEGVVLEIDAPDPHLEFTGDAGVLDQLLLNLTINAIKFAGPDRKVRLACRRAEGDRIEFTVTDHGPGMSKADAARALRPFETTAAPGLQAKSDTGLGLPLARMFAELHGGTLELETASGKGTCARVMLPDEAKRAA